MRLSLLFFFTVAVWSQALNSKADELVTLIVPGVFDYASHYSETITLAAGDSAKAVYGQFSGGNIHVFELTIGALTFDLPISTTAQYSAIGTPIIAGPATIRLRSNGTTTNLAIVTLSITRANSVANVIPANAVVIPEDAGGQYQVVLESSTDLLNWVVANPGTYGGSTQRRFFRTRILKLN